MYMTSYILKRTLSHNAMLWIVVATDLVILLGILIFLNLNWTETVFLICLLAGFLPTINCPITSTFWQSTSWLIYVQRNWIFCLPNWLNYLWITAKAIFTMFCPITLYLRMPMFFFRIWNMSRSWMDMSMVCKTPTAYLKNEEAWIMYVHVYIHK